MPYENPPNREVVDPKYRVFVLDATRQYRERFGTEKPSSEAEQAFWREQETQCPKKFKEKFRKDLAGARALQNISYFDTPPPKDQGY